MTAWRIKSNTGCNHLSGEPCSRCWYTMDGRWPRLQGQPPQIPAVSSQLMPSFPEDVVFEHAFHPWERERPVSSREELRELCERQGVDSVYLKESSVWRSGPRRWV